MPEVIFAGPEGRLEGRYQLMILHFLRPALPLGL